MKNTSPLRYPGGKTRACKIIHEVINRHFDLTQFDTLASPFFGGGSFEFYFQNMYNCRLIVNDKFIPLYNFWEQVKTNKELLCSSLDNIINVSKEEFGEFRKLILEFDRNYSLLTSQEDKLINSVRYFIINRCSFSGATLSGGFSGEASSKRYTPSSIKRIRSLDLMNTEIHNLDFECFISTNSYDNTLMFLDPPYYLEKSKSKLYGNNGDMHEHFDHEKLFKTISSSSKNWIMTYNNCDYIKNMYQDYNIVEVDWSYGMNKSKKSSEIIIMSKSSRENV
jgi:DNA adenine methylase